MEINQRNVLAAVGALILGYFAYFLIYTKLLPLQNLADVVWLVLALGLSFALLAIFFRKRFPTVGWKAVVFLNTYPIFDGILKTAQESNLTATTIGAALLLPFATLTFSLAGWGIAGKITNIRTSATTNKTFSTDRAIAIVELLIFLLCLSVVIFNVYEIQSFEPEEKSYMLEAYFTDPEFIFLLITALACLVGSVTMLLNVKRKYIFQVVPAIPIAFFIYILVVSQTELTRLKAISAHPTATSASGSHGR